MADSEQTLITFLDLASASKQRRRLSESDKLMVLAAAVGAKLGWPEVAEACRTQVLAHNPRHLVRRWPTIEAALTTERFQLYLKHVQRQYPPERAEYMLGCLGQRPVFPGYSAHETANALLDKIARQPTVVDGAKSSSQVASHGDADGHGRSSAGQSRHRLGATVGGERRVNRLSPRSVAKRLRSRKLNQEFLWWPYFVGLALLAVAILVWAARRSG